MTAAERMSHLGVVEADLATADEAEYPRLTSEAAKSTIDFLKYVL